jgi:DNA-binding MarR family transcriptional regulator
MAMATLVMDNKGTWRDTVATVTGIPFGRFRALRRLENESKTQAELGAQLGIDAPATSVLVSELLADGLVTRVVDPADGRRKLVSATEEGKATVRRVRELPEAAPPPLDMLSDDEVATLAAIIRKMQGDGS